ncbi:MAG TPA: phosphatase PAP2 family protein [Gemmatimonadota bacterium]|nr:phosphatase PAP2 family protein [Gemmatimonadota bacterium]
MVTAAYVGAVWGIGRAVDLPPASRPGPGSLLSAAFVALTATLIVIGCLLVVFAASWLLRRVVRSSSDARPFGTPWSVWRAHLSAERVVPAFVTLFLYAVLMDTFVGIKGQIPALHPFAWDEAFMRLDRTLHFGTDPWVLLQPLVVAPMGTALLDRLYYIWFPVNLIILIAFAWRHADRLRSRFFLAFFGLWILLGTAMAVAFSSAGPCYYGRVVTGPDPFAPLMAYLHRVDAVHPLTALDVQALLWDGYVGRERLVEGIAAMPSLHVAVPVLFTIVMWGIDRRLGVLFGVYTALILVGSVHLGWHYAIDGYVTLALVPAVWWLAGRIAPDPSSGG